MIVLLRASTNPLSLSDIARAMYMHAEALEPVLDGFVKQGIFQVLDGQQKCYVCLPDTTELREAIEETVRAYSQKRTMVVGIIYSSPLEYFSDAFKLKGGEN